MIDAVISKYLESHRRLVVPKLGAFLVKQTDGVIVFSEFMKQDDGVLHALLCQEEGLNDLEAAAKIDRFVFSVRHNIKHGTNFPVGGVGILSLGPNNTIAFHYDPATQPLPDERHEPMSRPLPQTGLHAADLANNAPAKDEEPTPVSEPAPEPQTAIPEPVEETAVKEIETEREEEEPAISKSPKMNPAAYVRGLQYRRPRKTTDAYEYNQPSQGRHMDKFLFVAIIAILLAVGAILFGYYVSTMNEEEDTLSMNYKTSSEQAE